MLMNRKCGIAIGLFLVAVLARAANYAAQKISVDGADVVRLKDTARGVVVSILPGSGNRAYELAVHGKQVLARPGGIPLLAPWANRLDENAFWANGKKYILNPGLETIHYDNNHLPIHGLLDKAMWSVTSLKADEHGAEATARLEFWRHPDWMAQFPFAHTLTMTHRLRDGVLEIETRIENLSDDSMPVSVGYHPWFQLSDAPRDEWKLHLMARDHLELSKTNIPTGKSEPVQFADPLPLKGVHLDDVLGGLIRNARGEAIFALGGKREKVTVAFGPKYQNAVVYAPPGRDVVCLEPMSGPTNAFNMAHDGTYQNLQSIPARGEWREIFSVKAEGF
jgi:aldose 1-epimerase